MKQRLVILGAGESGFGTAVLGVKQGYDVFVSDGGKIKDIYKKQLTDWKIEFEEAKHTEEKILNADVVMKSPGIPEKAEMVKKIRSAGIKIVSEIEFGSWFTDAQIVGITGANGKTTTTALTYHLMKQGGMNVGLGGNIGQSFAYQVATENFDYYVLEISSFQLDDIEKFRPNISVLTNITPDHLDVISWTPILFATSTMDRPESRTRLTAWSLYSWVKLRRVATRFPPLRSAAVYDRVSTRSGTVQRPGSEP